jgi:leucyl-tRNA synthetase
VTMVPEGETKALKMSKSKGNVVSLDDAVMRFGADATRIATLYLGPAEMDAEWDKDSDKVFAGPFRFLERIWRVAHARPFDGNWRETIAPPSDEADAAMRRKTHQTILKVGSDIERFSLNTAIAAQMEQLNALSGWLEATKAQSEDVQNRALYSEAIEAMLGCLSPFAPHLADELLEELGFAQTSFEMSWPLGNEELARESEFTLPVQVNGKLRVRLNVPADVDQSTLEAAALSAPEVQAMLNGKAPKRIIVVPGRLVNIVI